MKSKTTAAILALFLGGFGVHRFYLGQIGLGFLYLLFCWTFIPSLIAFVDFIAFLVMDEENFDFKYNPDKTIYGLPQGSDADELEKLYQLRQRGILTEEEYQYKKSELF